MKNHKMIVCFFLIATLLAPAISCNRVPQPFRDDPPENSGSTTQEGSCYYVSQRSGDDNNSGKSEDDAWRHIEYAASMVEAGDTVKIEGGIYTKEFVVVANAGTADAPIVFIGHKGIPVLDGVEYEGNGITISGKQYVTLKNIRVKRYRYGIWSENSNHTVIDGCVADSCSNVDYVGKGWDGYGITLKASHNSIVRNCSATDNGGNNFFFNQTDNSLIENCKSYSRQSSNNQWATDYYFIFSWCDNNIVKNSHCENVTGWGKGDHGFFFKDTQGSSGGHGHSTGNQVLDCVGINLSECFAVAHGAHHNTFENCHSDNSSKSGGFNTCLMARDGAHDNVFRECTSYGGTMLAVVYDGSVEGGPDQEQTANLFENCLFVNGDIGVYLRSSKQTTFKNCNFVNVENMFRFSVTSFGGTDDNEGTLMSNCILYNVRKTYDTSLRDNGWGLYNAGSYSMEPGYDDMDDVKFEYSDFWGGFPMIAGIGNISEDPLFADLSKNDYHLKSQEGRWSGGSWINDDVTSPCINAGNPKDDYSNEPTPNGGRINIGYHGNTAEASKSSVSPELPADADVITLTTDKEINGTNTIRLGIYAQAEDQSEVWIDLNGNGTKDEGEEPSFIAGNVGTGMINYVLGANTVSVYGKVYRFDCYNNSLTALLTETQSLINLQCYQNKIYGEAMTALINSLEDVSSGSQSGQLFLVNTASSSEMNSASVSEVAHARGKGWVVYDYNGGSRIPYEGIATNQKPVASIVEITPATAKPGDVIFFKGSATDADGTITEYEWKSSISGVFGTTAELEYSGLPAGNHVITFRAKDDKGEWSDPVSRTLVISDSPAPAGDLVGHWKYDDGSGSVAIDSSPNGNNGSLTEGISWVSGKYGGAVQMGEDQLIRVPTSPSIKTITKGFTVTIWGNTAKTEDTAIQCFASQYYYGPSTHERSWYITLLGTGVVRFQVCVNGQSGGANAKLLETEEGAYTWNRWTHVAVTFDGVSQRIYIDGELKAEVETGFDSVYASANDLIFGGWETETKIFYPFLGMLDDARIYNRALSEAEIQAVMAMEM